MPWLSSYSTNQSFINKQSKKFLGRDLKQRNELN